ncbi:hypothetical protein L210DRAFT_2490639 [Boletus edulis BED1]|uniref:Uncharacterized protein n=1 Tax=Boletus edulis BED1 TaxID=1328754 RepID=A0AAD4BP87_BOLED|nr:hypothetical protein L210DRAFT_2490639 [Boletus edulis BED1]
MGECSCPIIIVSINTTPAYHDALIVVVDGAITQQRTGKSQQTAVRGHFSHCTCSGPREVVNRFLTTLHHGSMVEGLQDEFKEKRYRSQSSASTFTLAMCSTSTEARYSRSHKNIQAGRSREAADLACTCCIVSPPSISSQEVSKDLCRLSYTSYYPHNASGGIARAFFCSMRIADIFSAGTMDVITVEDRRIVSGNVNTVVWMTYYVSTSGGRGTEVLK